MSRNMLLKLSTLCFCLAGSLALAQNQPFPSTSTSPGTFSGRLTGSSMDGATITLTNSTGVSQTATTDSTGSFSFSNLTPGSYRVMVRLKSGLQLAENSVEVTSAGSGVQVTLDAGPATGAGVSLKLTASAPRFRRTRQRSHEAMTA